MNEQAEFEQAVRAVIAGDAITQRIASHWSTLYPDVEAENAVISAALSGYMAPVECGVSRFAFSGHRVVIWAALEQHYAHASGFEAPDLEALATWINANGCQGPMLEELRCLRDERAFQVREYVLRAAETVCERHRARCMVGELERACLRLHAGERVAQVKESLTLWLR